MSQADDKRKYARIGLVTALMAAGVFAAGSALRDTTAGAASAGTLVPEVIEGEAETFRLASKAMALRQSTEEKNAKRTLESFYARRAYPGAPPVIPHALLEDRSMGGKSCLGCHSDGGFVPPFKAYAPVTPHPDLVNCRQCHVPQKDIAAFRETSFPKLQAPAINEEALPGGPPPVPHDLQMRENCLACHGGPAAVAEIRTPHPERVNCRQCHVPGSSNESFQRGGVR